ncbi:MAG: SUMF1/EgtB/PvdO family nonheme iron enzyme [Saprospiraceae bacterium]
MSTEIQPVRIFIAYSSKDLVYKEEIRRRLKPLLRAGKISIWDNYNIEAGVDWDTEIREKLDQSDLILLLLSPDALDSDYFYEVEAPIALQRHEAGQAIAVGVLLRPCALKHTPFEKLERYELLPKKGYPVTHEHWHNADAAYLTIFEEIDILVEKVEGLRLAQILRLQRQQEYSDCASEAQALVKKKKWAEAKAVLDNALAVWEAGFEPVREGLEKQRNKCGEELLNLAEVKRKKLEEHRQREEADHSAWNIAQAAATEGAYQKYVREHPMGIHLAAALVALHDIEADKKETERKKQAQEANEQRAREVAAQKQQEEAARKKREQEQAEAKKRETEATARRADPFADLMIPIKGGSFDMGDTFGDGGANEKPVHRVTVPDFHLCKYPVTQDQWIAIMGDNPAHFKGDENLPVEQVSWEDTQVFIKKLNEKTGKTYRLPTEAEWEYAARAGGKKVRFGNGKNIADPKEINFNGGKRYKQPYSIVGEYRAKTTVVGAFAANALGLYGMSGNVSEWCQDWYADYPSQAQTNPAGPASGSDRVLRGGSWYFDAGHCRVTDRGRILPGYRDDQIGFRLASSPQ